MRTRLPRRGGFTLVELIVAMALILVLVALAAGVAYSGILDSHKLTAGTDRINSWLIQARAKAARTQSPAGVRFIIGPDGLKCTEAQFIEVPDPYNPNPTGRADGYQLVFLNHVPATPPGALPVRELHVISNNAALPLSTIISEVSVGDVLSCPEFTTLHRVLAVSPAPVSTLQRLQNPALPFAAGSNNYVTIQSVPIFVTNEALLPNLGGLLNSPNVPGPPPAYNPAQLEFVPNYATTTFGFLRQPRPTLGEDTLQLSSGAVIDISGNPTLPTTLHDKVAGTSALNANSYLDVLFSPSGEVLNASQGKIILWVRNPDFPHPRTSGDGRVNYEAAGEMSLIVVYTKTGTVSTQPVKLPAGANFAPNETPHDYAKDGINNGL
jgi:prepilin-type N-terminal cleavage/methylation domain-containing protein